MNDFAHEIKKLSRSQWITKGAAKTLEAFHKAAIAQAVENARKGQYHDDLVVIDDFVRDIKKINIASESLRTTSTIRDKMVRAWDAAILKADNAA